MSVCIYIIVIVATPFNLQIQNFGIFIFLNINKINKQGDLGDAREITAVWCWNDKKKTTFVAAILDFWRAFLNQFWPNLVHTYKIHFWLSCVLCVVFKCQYFWSYSRKTHFWPFIYIFQRAVTHSKNVRLTSFFSTGSSHSS